MDRILSSPRARELAEEPVMAPLSDLRRRVGADLSDEEFLLRATMPAAMIDAMQAAGPAPRDFDPAVRPVMALVEQLLARTDLTRVPVERPGFRLELEAAGD
jgi:oxaloacetate decarboxylase alpha subunit